MYAAFAASKRVLLFFDGTDVCARVSVSVGVCVDVCVCVCVGVCVCVFAYLQMRPCSKSCSVLLKIYRIMLTFYFHFFLSIPVSLRNIIILLHIFMNFHF